jgi:hypothetical protein
MFAYIEEYVMVGVVVKLGGYEEQSVLFETWSAIAIEKVTQHDPQTVWTQLSKDHKRKFVHVIVSIHYLLCQQNLGNCQVDVR